MCLHHSSDHVRNPLLCILPPHILTEISKRGEPRHKEWALRTLAASERFRGNREILGELLGLFPAGAQQKTRSIYDAGTTETLPGTPIRQEGDPPSGDSQVDEAYEGAGA